MVRLGNFGYLSKTSYTFSVSSIVPNYQNLTEENFLFNLSYIQFDGNAWSGVNVIKSYNAETGILTVNSGDYHNNHFNAEVVCIYTDSM